MEKHINTVAALQIGLSIFNLIMALAVYSFMKLIGGFVDDPSGEMVLTLIANMAATFLIILSFPGIIAGLGLYRRKEWARILTLILSVIHIFNFPFGTAIGIYSIWVLIQPESVAAFGNQEPKHIY
jgi:Ni,Fe-hydrogenase I cytochrome b subunit